MPLQSSGAITINQIRTELGSASYSLRTLSAAAGKGTPDSMSEFYGYSSWSASGGNSTTNSGGYRVHTFTSSGTLSVSGTKSVEIIAVGGGGAAIYRGEAGGGASYDGCGGGGAGGWVNTTVTISSNLNITIGGGGGGILTQPSQAAEAQGSPTTITGGASITANGGGRGGRFNTYSVNGLGPGNGGCGGGRGRGPYGGVGGAGSQGGNGGWRSGFTLGNGPGGGGGTAVPGGNGSGGNRGGGGGYGNTHSWLGSTTYLGGGSGIVLIRYTL